MVWTGRKQIPVWYGGLTHKAGNGAWSLDAVWLLRLVACSDLACGLLFASRNACFHLLKRRGG